ncbi:MAG: EamA family transporter [Candidatus Nanosalina sp.]
MALSTELVVFLALVSSFFSASMSALMKNESEKFSALKTSFMVIFYALLFLAPYVALRIYWSGLTFDSFSLAAALLAGFFGTGKVWAGVRAFQEIDFSVAQPMKKLAPLFVVVGELLFIGLNPSIILLLGIFLSVAGSYVLMIDSSDLLSPFRNLGDLGVQLAVLSAVFSALGALSIRFASGGIPEYVVTHLWYLANLAGLAVMLWYLESLPSRKLFFSRNFVAAGALSSVTGVLSVFLYAVASSVALVTAVFQSSVLFSVLIGGGIFEEENTALRLAGAIIIVAGIIMLSQV